MEPTGYPAFEKEKGPSRTDDLANVGNTAVGMTRHMAPRQSQLLDRLVPHRPYQLRVTQR